MLIIAGRLHVDPEARDAYLTECTEVVRLARDAPGCLDFSLAADLLDDTRINVHERWETEEQLLAFRGSGPSGEQRTAIRDADVHRYLISGVEAP